MGKVFVEAKDVKNGRFIDTRFNLQDSSWGQLSYEESHIEGAIYWDLERDLSDMSKAEGRHPMPSKEQLENLFKHAGLTTEQNIYIYDQGGAPFAARAWWMLKYANFPNVFIINGGFEQLKEAGFATTKEIPIYTSSALSIDWNEGIYASRQDVKRIVDGEVGATLLDARSAERYRGENEPIDKVAGHIPTAKNFDWEQLKEGTRLQPNEQLSQTVNEDEEIVVYCGSGVTASPVYAALADAGYDHLKLYVGSYSDWITQYEVETSKKS